MSLDTDSKKTHINSLVDLVDRGSKAWSTLSHHHATNSTITHVNIKKCMFNTCHIPDTPISHYYSEIIACANKLQGIGVQVSPHEVQDLIIANLPTGEWTTYGASILMCPGSLLVQDLTRLLDDFKWSQGQIGQQDAVQGALMVTSGGDSRGGQGRGQGGCGAGNGNNRGGNQKCYRCNELGHVTSQCTAPAPVNTNEENEMQHHALMVFERPSHPF